MTPDSLPIGINLVNENSNKAGVVLFAYRFNS
jgi:hypothetical protein